MITVRIKGGLGNQLFQYATGYALSKELGQELNFNLAFTANMTVRGYKLADLKIDMSKTICDSELSPKVILLKNYYVNKLLRVLRVGRHRYKEGVYFLETEQVYYPELFQLIEQNIYLDGYFQTEKYFRKYREELLKQITPRYEPEKEYIHVLEKIRNCNAVAVHVRRSDFKNDHNKYHYLLDNEYFQKGIAHIRRYEKSPFFFWFSDEPEWVKSNIEMSNDMCFVNIKTEHSDIDDMMLMKHCNHIIVANSTFSWWAAWLNEHENAIRIVPKKPFGNKYMIPDSWIKI